jgi:hypothetical protein
MSSIIDGEASRDQVKLIWVKLALVEIRSVNVMGLPISAFSRELWSAILTDISTGDVCITSQGTVEYEALFTTTADVRMRALLYSEYIQHPRIDVSTPNFLWISIRANKSLLVSW